MKEFIAIAFSAVNIIPTALLLLVMVYWLTVFIGLLDFNSFDLDIDTDVDVGADVDVDANIDHDIGADGNMSLSWFGSVLSFFNLGQIPFMIWLSFLVLPMWGISMLVNDYLQVTSFGVSLALLVPNIIVSLFVSKILTLPFARLFAKMDDGKQDEDLVGKVATTILPVDSKAFGQIDVEVEDYSVQLKAISTGGQKIESGQKVLIIDYLKEEEVYLVEPYLDMLT